MRHSISFLSVVLAACVVANAAVAQTSKIVDQPAKVDSKEQVRAEQDAKRVPQVTEERPMSFWMEKKLELSKSMLESLTKGEFDQLQEEAGQLQRLGKIEGFVRRKNSSYRIQLRNFDISTQEVMRQANRKNVEGAALAFNQLTTSCVACHVMLREGLE